MGVRTNSAAAAVPDPTQNAPAAMVPSPRPESGVTRRSCWKRAGETLQPSSSSPRAGPMSGRERTQELRSGCACGSVSSGWLMQSYRRHPAATGALRSDSIPEAAVQPVAVETTAVAWHNSPASRWIASGHGPAGHPCADVRLAPRTAVVEAAGGPLRQRWACGGATGDMSQLERAQRATGGEPRTTGGTWGGWADRTPAGMCRADRLMPLAGWAGSGA